MVFSSHIFLFYFLPLALAVYYGMWRTSQRWRNFALAALGYVFYGWADPRFVVLMFATTFVDWLLSLVVAFDTWRVWTTWNKPIAALPKQPRSRLQKRAITLSVISNLAMLGFFKYFNFGLASYNGLIDALGLGLWKWDVLFRVSLPLGISFYTFQSLSYAIDVYRGEARAMRNFVDFSCFVSMFPHLVAGPILKFSFLAEQLEQRSHTVVKFARGVAFISLGLAKKILIANACGKVADVAFDAGSVGCLDAWVGAVAYAFQIYFDFSAYSDMAIGLGLMLGFVFAKNFDSPYLAQSVTEFWRRWHISLSTWLREYLYIPLGGNRKGRVRTYINLGLVMLLGGLWHGASWNFIVWGAMHGGMLVVERACGGPERLYAFLPRSVRVGLTFVIVLFSWVFFRAADLPAAVNYCASMLGLNATGAGAPLLSGVMFQPYYVGTLALAACIAWGAPQTWDWTRRLSWPKMATIAALFVLSLVMLSTQAYNPFIYFIF